jgi:hypothetical protein
MSMPLVVNKMPLIKVTVFTPSVVTLTIPPIVLVIAFILILSTVLYPTPVAVFLASDKLALKNISILID